MAKKEKQKNFVPMQKVIWMRPIQPAGREPVIAWVPEENLYPAIGILDGNYRVRVTTHEEDAQGGRGLWVSQKFVFGYTNDLWLACEEWYRRRDELDKELKQIVKGKVPDGYFQPSLLSLEA